jgi:hypothetical protein
MDDLFIRLYLDEDVDILITKIVQARGLFVSTARDEGKLGQSDAAQLVDAVARRRILVTHDRVDFESLVRECVAAGKEHYGVIIAVRRPPRKIGMRFLRIVNQVTADEMRSQLRYI